MVLTMDDDRSGFTDLPGLLGALFVVLAFSSAAAWAFWLLITHEAPTL